MFAVHIYHMIECVNSYMGMFADDVKILRKVQKEENGEALQQDFDKMREWSRRWIMGSNINNYI